MKEEEELKDLLTRLICEHHELTAKILQAEAKMHMAYAKRLRYAEILKKTVD